MPGGIQPPVEEMLKWPKSNYENPLTRPHYVLVTACVLGPLTVAMLFARLWVRVRMQRNAGLDDWLMLASLFPIVGITVLSPIAIECLRFDRHVWDVDPKYFPLQRKAVLSHFCMFTLASGLVKMSVLLFYRRLGSRAVSPVFRWVMRIMMAVIGGYTLSFIAVLVFVCRPISAFWDQVNFTKLLVPGGYHYSCFNEGADVVANGIVSTVQDLIVAFLPTLLCWNLQMPFRQKVALYGIFTISYTTVIIGALRTWTSYRIYFESYDVTWIANETFLLSLLELYIGAMCANAPALKVFFKAILNSERITKIISSRSSKSRSNNSSKTPRSDPTSTAISKTSAWIPIGLWRSQHSRSASGYLSEPHSTVTTDKHGGIVPINAPVQIEYYERDSNSISKPTSPEYTDTIVPWRTTDVEMGEFQPPLRENRRSEIQALPRLPVAPESVWKKPMRALPPFYKK